MDAMKKPLGFIFMVMLVIYMYIHWTYTLFDELGICFMAPEYPGYGGANGKLSSVDDLYLVAESAYAYAIGEGFDSSGIFVRGYSLGGGVASYLATTHDLPRLILQSTYTSLVDVAASHYRFLPVRSLFQRDIDTATRLQTYTGKVLVTHGQDDVVVPYTHAISNSSYADNATLITHPGGHNGINLLPYIKQIQKRFED